MAKRQKIVFADFFDVAHIWVHQTQEESRCRSILHEDKSLELMEYEESKKEFLTT